MLTNKYTEMVNVAVLYITLCNSFSYQLCLLYLSFAQDATSQKCTTKAIYVEFIKKRIICAIFPLYACIMFQIDEKDAS